MAANMCISAHR